MDQLIEAFGIDVKLIVVQIINFTLLAVILTYFLYKPVLKVMHDREEKITQGVKDAEQAAKTLAGAEAEKQTILTDAHKEAENVARRAKEHADEKAAAIAAVADKKAAGIVTSAEEKAENIKLTAKQESEAEIAKLAVLAAEKVLKEQV